MQITIDNIFAFLVLILILITFMGYIIPSAYLSFTTVKEHQLEEVAQAIMDKVLLSLGYPEDWGDILVVESSDELSSFGLQKAGGEPYELDVDKVLRIMNIGEGQLPETVQIDAETVASLLGLNHEYGLSIRITPALNMTATVREYYDFKSQVQVPSLIDVTVKTPEGRPAISANVTGIYIFMTIRKQGQEDISYVNYTFNTEIANYEGMARLNFTDFLKDAEDEMKSELKKSCSAIVVYADYYGIRSVNSSTLGEASSILKGTTVGDYLIVSLDDSIELPPAARHLQNLAGLANPPYYVYLSTLHNETNGESGMVINHGSKKYRVYELSSTVDDDVAFMMMPVKYRGDYYAVTFFRPPSTCICQIGMASGNIKTSVLRRMVRIGSFHYIFEVRVWRWGEG